jgi:hypothetical protein
MGRRRIHKKKTVWHPKPRVAREPGASLPPNVRFVCPEVPGAHVFDLRIRQIDIPVARLHCPYCETECEKHEIRPVHS